MQELFVGAKVKLVAEEYHYCGGTSPRKEYDGEVTRITKCYAVVDGHRFRLSDGLLSTKPSDKFHWNTRIV